MARAKNRYGTPLTAAAFWAYSVDAKDKVVLVRCGTAADARDEAARMKQSDARLVGVTTRAIPEMDMWAEARRRGWKLALIR